MVTLELHRVECIEFTRARGFLEDLVDGGFEVSVESLKEIFEEQGQQLPSTIRHRRNEFG